jgi:hypothetical protein
MALVDLTTKSEGSASSEASGLDTIESTGIRVSAVRKQNDLRFRPYLRRVRRVLFRRHIAGDAEVPLVGRHMARGCRLLPGQRIAE